MPVTTETIAGLVPAGTSAGVPEPHLR